MDGNLKQETDGVTFPLKSKIVWKKPSAILKMKRAPLRPVKAETLSALKLYWKVGDVRSNVLMSVNAFLGCATPASSRLRK